MHELSCARVTTVSGVAEDFRGKPGQRQVTVLTHEGWQAACSEIGVELAWVMRRANLYIGGVDLQNSIGSTLQIGQMQLLITRETDPCNRMKAVCDGLLEALEVEWRGGVCCRVTVEGSICVGDRVEIISHSEASRVVVETRRWVKEIIIRHNFCPFAHKPFQQGTIRYAVTSTREPQAVVESLISELLMLRNSDRELSETTLLVTPNCFAHFADYNDFLDVVDALIEELHLVGVIQVASFHPDYQFADLGADDVRNYTNRSLYPMFHLILEDSIEHARATHPDVEGIPQTNMDLLQKQGLEESQRQLEVLRNQ